MVSVPRACSLYSLDRQQMLKWLPDRQISIGIKTRLMQTSVTVSCSCCRNTAVPHPSLAREKGTRKSFHAGKLCHSDAPGTGGIVSTSTATTSTKKSTESVSESESNSTDIEPDRRRSLLKCSSQMLDWYNRIKHRPTKHTIK